MQSIRPAVANRRLLHALTWVVVAAVLVVVFYLSPLEVGDDWETFYGAARRMLTGAQLYGEKVTSAYYSNPPWVAAILAPFGLLPTRWGWSMLSAATILIVAALARRYLKCRIGLVLVLLSPPFLYTLLHGQIDGLVLGGVLLPTALWPLVGLTKPQVALALSLGVKRREWLAALLGIAASIALSLLLVGNWLRDLIQQPTPFVQLTHNLWLGIWPFQVPVGMGLCLLALERKDERYLIAASPFLWPYAATSSMLGPWLAAVSGLRWWQALVVLAVWWGAAAYRAIIGA
ncbi:MAG: hypothetical protein PVJ32_06105 [Anaerolineales bacterium]